MINNTIYKNTSVGLIPIDWEVKKLGEIAKVKHGRDQKKVICDSGIYPILGTGGEIGRTNSFLYDKPSVLIGRKGTIDKPRFMDTPFWTVDTLFYTELSQDIVPIWLFNVFQTINWYYYNESSGVPSLSGSNISAIPLPIPPLLEQQKIASILSTWDNAIDITKKVLSNLEVIKKAMTINVLSGKIRFKTFLKNNKISQRNGYSIPDDWEVKNLSSVLEQVKKPVKPEKDTLYKQLGIRSHTKGIFYKDSVTGQSLGNKSVFAIEPDCFILNIVFAWEHAIAKTTIAEQDMIVSHRFPMYKPLAPKLDLDYLLFFFKSKKGKDLLGLASPGGAGRNKTLGQKEFLKLKIPIPPIKEQKAIALFLETYDSEIKLHQQKLQALQLQKKGLMQQLLTGKVRVKTNN
ncbi:restriction endonuclease subunit S [Flavobacterium sp. T12S277]|uniref:restriction endonuclease subunit S n=1 Tax=Flavobacterium sp. T12S277 TaxID=3402752 RepID=UPI003ADD03B2